MWLKDAHFALRRLARRPASTLVAVLTLAIGITATTASFSVVNAILLRRLPFEAPDRLVTVWSTDPEGNRSEVSYPDYQDLREQCKSIAELAAYNVTTFKLAGEDRSERLNGEFVSASYFPLLGVTPARGRFFSPEEDRHPGNQAVAVVSHALWQRRFGGDPGLIDRIIELDGISYTVLGIASEGFQGLHGSSEVFIPISMFRDARPQFRFNLLVFRPMRWFDVVGRLAPGTTLKEAGSELELVATQLEATYPDTNASIGFVPESISGVLIGDLRTALLVPLVAALLLLVISLINVANLLLTQVAERRREAALRMANGASPGRLIRQLVTESVVLALPAGVLGVLMTVWALRGFVGYAPFDLPAYVRVTLDLPVLGFTLLLTLATGVLFGLAPALSFSKTEITSSLQEGGRGHSGGLRHRFRRNLPLVGEVALAVLLLTGAGLLLRSYRQLVAVDPGFDASEVLSAKLDTPVGYSQDRLQVLITEILERVGALPGVQGVGLDSDVFLGGDEPLLVGLTLEGREPVQGRENAEVGAARAFRHTVSPNFFQEMGIELYSGRGILSQDHADAPGVAVISRSMVRRYWPDEDPVGQRLKMGGASSPRPWLTVVGVVEDIQHRGLVSPDDEPPDLYLPLRQSRLLLLGLMVRTRGEPAELAGALVRNIEGIDPEVVVHDVAPVAERLDNELSDVRFTTRLTASSALLAVVLAAIGIFSVMAFTVAQRRREIGIRMALGAPAAGAVKLILRQSLVVTAWGLALGLVVAWITAPLLDRQLADVLFNVSATDPVTFVLAALVVLAVVTIACYVPARRASRIDPVTALRWE